MDRIFHCNCYFFWPEPGKVAGELYRVLKPGGFMVTTIWVDSVEQAARYGFLEGTNWEPEPYMDTLRSKGFADVAMEDFVDEDLQKGTTYQAIFAHRKLLGNVKHGNLLAVPVNTEPVILYNEPLNTST